MVRSNWLKSLRGLFPTRGLSNLTRQVRGAKRIRSTVVDVAMLESRSLLSASPALWQEVEAFPASRVDGQITLNLADYTPLTMNESALRQTLDAAPEEWNFNVSTSSSEITLVDPNGEPQRFTLFETAIMAPELGAQFPEIKTYAGQGIDDPAATVQIDLTPQGFHAQVLSPNGRWYVDPYYHLNDDFYASYYSSNARLSDDTVAALKSSLDDDVVASDHDDHADDVLHTEVTQASMESAGRTGGIRRTFRTAVAATGEYTAFHGGTVGAGLSAIVTAINRVSGIYLNELTVQLQLVVNNNILIYTNAATDPYSNNNAFALLGENQTNIDTLIGDGNYDIGHVFTTGGGGLAGLGVVGISGQKASGETGLPTPIGDPFYVDYVAHEMGHQFGGNHTFNQPDGNRNAATAYEPGSGSTIQAYAGLFGVDDLQSNSDPYFHSVSFDEMIRHVDVVIPNVGSRVPTGNIIPTVNAGLDYTIPAATPFVLTATGSDGDVVDPLTYNWEQRDLGPAQTLAQADNGSSPLFRSWTPTSNPSRTFPRLSDLVNNTTARGERLPTTTRTMNFRAIVRDNRVLAGGVNTDDMRVNVINTGAPFRVTGPNTAVTWQGFRTENVTWDVAGTDGNGIDTQNVRILLSTDGGLTYPTVLAASVPNNGSAQITVPNTPTTQARIRVEAVGNIFFDISDTNFTIEQPTNFPPVIDNQTFFVIDPSPMGAVVGTVVATDPDVGNTLTYSIDSGNTGNAFAINPATGELTINNPSAIDFLTTPTFALQVTVQDNGSPQLSDTAVITINVFEVNAAPTVQASTFTVPENLPNGSIVGTVIVNDSNVGQTHTFSIVGNAPAFAINPSTGVITVANSAALNFEVTPSFAFTVQATDNGQPPLSGTALITVNLTNVNDPPKIEQKVFSVLEHAPANTVVGTVTATDDDAGQTRTFSITGGNPGNAFKINSTTGVISVNNSAAVDWETSPSFALRVTATDDGSPAAASTATITINVTNINDPPTGVGFLNVVTAVAENVAKTTRVKVADIVVVDDGLGTNALSLSGVDASIFEIVGNGLFVKAGTDLNFEAKPTYVVAVNVDDVTLGSTPDASANFTLNLVDINESPIMPGGVIRLVENSPVGTVVASGFASDPDAGQLLTYAIESGNRNNAFVINPATGVITVNNPAALDYENEPPFELKIGVIDNGAPSLKATGILRIFLTDANDAPIVYRATKSIPENLPVGSLVLDYKIVASDRDPGQTLTYAIIAGNTNNAFAMNPTTGLITVNNPQMMDYENTPPFELTIAVTDNGTPSLTSTANLRITFTNVNDAPGVYNATVNVLENSPVGTQVLDYKIVARDQDQGQLLTFAITGGNRGDTFTVNPDTGIITVKNPALLDFETGAPFDLTMSVTDNGSPSRTSVANLRVNIKNVNEAPKVTDAATMINENVSAGTVVFDQKTVTSPPEPGQSFKFAITGGNRQNAFAINPTTGVVTINNPAALNFETEAPFDLTVSVSDSMNAALTTSGKLKVILKDVNEAPTVTNAEKTIPENLTAGSTVYDAKLIAKDVDVGQTLKFAITGGNTGNAFAINVNTGIITVSNAAAIDFETNPVFSLKITATDSATPALSTTGTLTVRLTDLREGPTVTPATFVIQENTATGLPVGTVAVSPLPTGQTRTFAITAGNTNNAFSINANGQIVVNNSAALNFEVKSSFALTVAVTDTGTSANTGTAVITVNLSNVNEPPVIPAQSLAVRTGAAVGTVVGTVSASDPDAGQTRSFAIVSGNGILNNVFSINASTGQITVNNQLALLFAREFELGIRVMDNGSPSLSSTGVVRIFVNTTGTLPARGTSNSGSTLSTLAIEIDTVLTGKPKSTTSLARLLQKGK